MREIEREGERKRGKRNARGENDTRCGDTADEFVDCHASVGLEGSSGDGDKSVNGERFGCLRESGEIGSVSSIE